VTAGAARGSPKSAHQVKRERRASLGSALSGFLVRNMEVALAGLGACALSPPPPPERADAELDRC
jgi:hypothetical protein